MPNRQMETHVPSDYWPEVRMAQSISQIVGLDQGYCQDSTVATLETQRTWLSYPRIMSLKFPCYDGLAFQSSSSQIVEKVANLVFHPKVRRDGTVRDEMCLRRPIGCFKLYQFQRLKA